MIAGSPIGWAGREEIAALCERVFLDGHSEGWSGNQLRRDTQMVDAEKGWQLYVSNGALAKSCQRTLRPSASAGGEYQRGVEDAAKAAENVGVVYKANASALGVSNSARRQIATAIRALTPSPAAPEVERAAQEMLVAFAEGVEWTDEKRAAYDALNRALSVVPEVAK